MFLFLFAELVFSDRNLLSFSLMGEGQDSGGKASVVAFSHLSDATKSGYVRYKECYGEFIPESLTRQKIFSSL